MLDNIKMEAVQIPARKDNSDFKDSVHWKIILTNGGARVETEYSEGIGHFFNTQHALYNKMIFKPVKEVLLTTGTCRNFIAGNASLTLGDIRGLLTERVKYNARAYTLTVTPPLVKDVLYSLTMNASGDFSSFETWRSDYGYDIDSRKAYEIYQACRDTVFKLQALGLNLEALQEFYQEY